MIELKKRKVNITGYLTLEMIDKLDTLAQSFNLSRNNLLEKAIADFLEKNKTKIYKNTF